MAVLEAKKLSGLVSSGTSTAQKVVFVCFTIPKEALRIAILTQKEILLLPFRCAIMTYKVVRKHLIPKQPTKNSTDLSDGHKFKGNALSSIVNGRIPGSDPLVSINDNGTDKESMLASILSSPVEGSVIDGKEERIALNSIPNGRIPGSDPLASKNDSRTDEESSHMSILSSPVEGSVLEGKEEGIALSSIPNGRIPGSDPLVSKNDSRTDKESLSESFLSTPTVESVLEMKEEGSFDSSASNDYVNTDIDSLEESINEESPQTTDQDSELTDDELEEGWRKTLHNRFTNADRRCLFGNSYDKELYLSQLKREVYYGLYATWELWERFKRRREDMGEEFHKMTRKFFNTRVLQAKRVDLQFMKELSVENDFVKTFDKLDHVTSKLKTVKDNLQRLCPKTAAGKRVLEDFGALQYVIMKTIEDNRQLRFVLYSTYNSADFFVGWKVEVFNLANQFQNMLDIDVKLKDLQHQLKDAQELLLRAECDRDDMVEKLETLAKMIKEEENFFTINYKYNKEQLKIGSCHEMEEAMLDVCRED